MAHLLRAGLVLLVILTIAAGVATILRPCQPRHLAAFLFGLAVLLTHDSYGNRLLPRPNWFAQVSGYTLALACFVMGVMLLIAP